MKENQKIDFLSVLEGNLQLLKDFIEKEGKKKFQGLISIGSKTKNNLRIYSDLNLILIAQDNDYESIKLSLKELFKENLILEIVEKSRIMFYFPYNMSKVTKTFRIEINFVNNMNQIKKFIIGSNLTKNDLESMIIIKYNINIKKEIEGFLLENEAYKLNMPLVIKKFINSFIDNFERASSKFDKTDTYAIVYYLQKCYHNLVLLETYKLGRMNNKSEKLPDLAFVDFDEKHVFPFYKNNLPKPSILETTKLRITYYNKFLSLINNLNDKYSIDLNIKKIQEFLDLQIKKNYFWNIRDISYLKSNSIKEGLIYRSSTLSRYNNDPKLVEFLTHNKIKTILDIRSQNEVKFQPYEISFSELKINYINVPIGQKDIKFEDKLVYVSENDPKEFFYELFPRFYQKEIKEIFETIHNIELPIIIHCYAGKDRTGMIIALLLDILGFEREEIIIDYLNTGNDTKINYINTFYAVIDEFGGLNKYLIKTGLTNDILISIRDKIILEGKLIS